MFPPSHLCYTIKRLHAKPQHPGGARCAHAAGADAQRARRPLHAAAAAARAAAAHGPTLAAGHAPGDPCASAQPHTRARRLARPTPRPSPALALWTLTLALKPEVLYEAAVAVEEAAVSSNDSYAHGFWPPQGAVAGVPAGFAIQARTQ